MENILACNFGLDILVAVHAVRVLVLVASRSILTLRVETEPISVCF